ncbi:MAG: hypothetical protein COA62_03875 [Rhodobiaceae bacterium]|nr:MAG: hypothetical protein COA62_03875 [Rhodobiaceae bacterium]
MSIFVAKMLTILGFVFYAGGPVDALRLAFVGPAETGPLSVTCEACERTAALDITIGPDAQDVGHNRNGSASALSGGSVEHLNGLLREK